MDHSNITQWSIIMTGKPGGLYEGGKFKISVSFPPNYPFSSPRVLFVTPIYHVNTNRSGSVCLYLLNNMWSPSLTVSKIMLSLDVLLENPDINSPLDFSRSALYNSDRKSYEEECRKSAALSHSF
ncbi:hypothetical protein DICPUDRAFT_33350 [Dictyostelium purpureum]|uniref:UBC core domain-containing protein n=1 Tax=Dictyostelium purpureum TaxID=5786 RepID=F0ZKN8_DICPU|nr:uncharacterized protein DICPUDRAFT_33350 [Dictyostelium purpureum]EGC35494.1 hypothetical protein DICPUDRAFT_33350 [Dictyostelium purpureum]|eukprot:XP_003287973.1 hypothetical protein DICPUDRAFT_33350 [Dictyostelium purpureum]